MAEHYDLSGAAECHLEINKVYRENVHVPEAGGTQLCILTLHDSVGFYREKYKLELTRTKQWCGANYAHELSYKLTDEEDYRPISHCFRILKSTNIALHGLRQRTLYNSVNQNV